MGVDGAGIARITVLVPKPDSTFAIKSTDIAALSSTAPDKGGSIVAFPEEGVYVLQVKLVEPVSEPPERLLESPLEAPPAVPEAM